MKFIFSKDHHSYFCLNKIVYIYYELGMDTNGKQRRK
jgi:hypothetical protein